MTPNSKPLSLRDLYMPFKVENNVHAQAAWRSTVEWVKRYDLVRDPAQLDYFEHKLDYYWLSAWAFPKADLEQLALVNDWMTLFYFFDKMWDDAHPWKLGLGQNKVLRTLELRAFWSLGNWYQNSIGFLLYLFASTLQWARSSERQEPSPTSPMVPRMDLKGALYDVRDRMKGYGSEEWRKHFAPRWRAHFAEGMEAYFAGCVWEAHNKIREAIPTVETYVEKRRATGAVQPSFELAGVLGLLPPMNPNALDDERVQKLSALANDVITLFNDLISLEKEKQVGDMHNLVFIIMKREGCDEETARKRVAKLHDETVREFEQRSKEFETQVLQPSDEGKLVEDWDPKDTQGVREYIDVLRCWMASNMEWSLMTERYRTPAPENAEKGAA
jgi:hypothetical protein